MSCGNPHATDCAKGLDQMFTYLDGELGEPDLHLVREHLAQCAPCMSEHDVDNVVKKLINRAGGGELATAQLRKRIVLLIAALSHVGRTTTVNHGGLELG